MTRKEWTFTITLQTNTRWSTKDTLNEAGAVAGVDEAVREDVVVVVKTLNQITRIMKKKKKRPLMHHSRKKQTH